MALNLTFSGAGFLGIYHVGVVSCLKFYGTKLLDKVDKFGGSSAGALTACMLLCKADLEESVQFVMHMASKVHGKFLGPLSPDFDPSRTIRKTFLKNMPEDGYRIASGKLFISMTRVSDWKNVVVSEFESNNDLVDALVCSCFIPMFSGVVPPKFMGEMYIDGGFTDNLPQEFGGVTITVSPFSGESDICPDDGLKTNESFDFKNTNVQLTMHNAYRMVQALFPPNADALCQMCKQGFRDTLKYLHLHYPELLNLDAHIVSIPQCCESPYCSCLPSSVDDSCSDDDSSCSCRTSNTTYFSDLENSLAKTKAIGQLIFPEKLNSILQSAKDLFSEGDMFWRLACALVRLGKWMASPYYYFSDEMYEFVDAIFKWLLPKLKEFCASNYYLDKSLLVAQEIYHAYHGTSTFEWHPTIKAERHKEIVYSRTRLLTAQQSLVLLPKSLNNIREDNENMSAPPPTRINSGYLNGFEIEEALNEVFTSDNEDLLVSENEEVHLPHCVKDDIINDGGLYFKLDDSIYGFRNENLLVSTDEAWEMI